MRVYDKILKTRYVHNYSNINWENKGIVRTEDGSENYLVIGTVRHSIDIVESLQKYDIKNRRIVISGDDVKYTVNLNRVNFESLYKLLMKLIATSKVFKIDDIEIDRLRMFDLDYILSFDKMGNDDIFPIYLILLRLYNINVTNYDLNKLENDIMTSGILNYLYREKEIILYNYLSLLTEYLDVNRDERSEYNITQMTVIYEVLKSLSENGNYATTSYISENIKSYFLWFKPRFTKETGIDLTTRILSIFHNDNRIIFNWNRYTEEVFDREYMTEVLKEFKTIDFRTYEISFNEIMRIEEMIDKRTKLSFYEMNEIFDKARYHDPSFIEDIKPSKKIIKFIELYNESLINDFRTGNELTHQQMEIKLLKYINSFKNNYTLMRLFPGQIYDFLKNTFDKIYDMNKGVELRGLSLEKYISIIIRINYNGFIALKDTIDDNNYMVNIHSYIIYSLSQVYNDLRRIATELINYEYINIKDFITFTMEHLNDIYNHYKNKGAKNNRYSDTNELDHIFANNVTVIIKEYNKLLYKSPNHNKISNPEKYKSTKLKTLTRLLYLLSRTKLDYDIKLRLATCDEMKDLVKELGVENINIPERVIKLLDVSLLNSLLLN